MTITMNGQTLVTGYAVLHVLFGLITHYHSIWQVRQFNMNHNSIPPKLNNIRIGSARMFILFLGRMVFGLPWFGMRAIIAPVGNRWHLTAEEIHKLSHDR